MGVSTNFVREDPRGLQCLTMIWATHVVEDVNKCLDSRNWDSLPTSILTWVKADTASAACPPHDGSLATTSITFWGRHLWRRRTLVGNNSVRAKIVFYYVAPEHNASFVLSILWFQFQVFEVACVHQCSKMN